MKANEPDYRLNEQVGFLLRRATQRHLAIFGNNIADLTPTQFAALAKLCEVGRLSQNQLGRETAMDAATIKGVIDRLRKRGLVETSPNETDKRRLYVEASLEGRELFRSVVAAAKLVTDATLEPLSAKEKEQFLTLLNKLT